MLAFAFVSPAQSSKKESGKRYRMIVKLDTAAIKKGKHLELAQTFSITHFIEYYVENGKEITTKKYGSLIITELYKDSDFTY